jgi:hypothetical protein
MSRHPCLNYGKRCSWYVEAHEELCSGCRWDRELVKLDHSVKWLGRSVCVYAIVVAGVVIWRVFF